MLSDENALKYSYVPQMESILVHTRAINPREKTTIYFKAPEQPGLYPYLCTFPGHGTLMRGVLKVVQ